MPAGHKKEQGLLTDGCEPPCGCWELNSGPLEEQSVLLTAEPSLRSSSRSVTTPLYGHVRPLSTGINDLLRRQSSWQKRQWSQDTNLGLSGFRVPPDLEMILLS
ncbi:rCG35761, isoform CRA_a [Rattus norvegicus]|uniref:RCG35761, isoform CRA_a n=1 Tax=Rattus norvegicus TaxID=10116 RepID=A6IKU2_RAT|nr:rCG35761, isoform CRA_a [Rattus norvegicus]EDM00358.1 rCG35761, isoform CRA_a [Rattus norvegicus]